MLLAALDTGLAEERLLKEEVSSKFLNASRTTRIYLPASYRQDSNHRYPCFTSTMAKPVQFSRDQHLLRMGQLGAG